jgi:hypothetical protein
MGLTKFSIFDIEGPNIFLKICVQRDVCLNQNIYPVICLIRFPGITNTELIERVG